MRHRPLCRTCQTLHRAPTWTKFYAGNERRGNTRYAGTRDRWLWVGRRSSCELELAQRATQLFCRFGPCNPVLEDSYSWTAAAAPLRTQTDALMASDQHPLGLGPTLSRTRTDTLTRPATRVDSEKSSVTRRFPARPASSANIPSYAPTTRRASRIRLRSGLAWAWARTDTTST